uniref:Uncharacterized protein n=1 Tax=Panagrolaimus davidi TaxID=227884 RepID=A0A914PH56_9BILA
MHAFLGVVMPFTSESARENLNLKKSINSEKSRKRSNQTLNATAAAANKRRVEELEARSSELDERDKLMNATYEKFNAELEAKSKYLELKEEELDRKAIFLKEWEETLRARDEILYKKEEELKADAEVAEINKVSRRRGPNVKLKRYDLLSRSQRRRRRKLAGRYGVPYSLPVDESLNVLTKGRLNRKQRRLLNRVSPKLFSSERATKKMAQNILNDINWEDAVTVDLDGEKVKVLSFAKVLLWRINNIGLNYLPEVPQVTFGGDGGGGVFKIGFYLNNLHETMSDDNFVVLAVFKGSEKYEHIKKIIDAALRDMHLLDEYEVLCEFFLVGDLKFLSICLGLQGCSATYFCIWCLAPLSSPSSNTDKLRCIKDLIDAGKRAEQKAHELGFDTPAFKAYCRLHNFSVCRPPLITFIEFTHIVPPVLHIITGIVNYILKHSKNKQLAPKLLIDAGLNVKFPSHDLRGGDVSKLLQYLTLTTEEYGIYGTEILNLMNEVKQFAKCKDYTPQQIEELQYLIQKLKDKSSTKFTEFLPSQKLHDIVFHVLPFFVLHQSWGRFTEQPVERCHQKIASLDTLLKNGNHLEYAHRQRNVQLFDHFVNAAYI